MKNEKNDINDSEVTSKTAEFVDNNQGEESPDLDNSIEYNENVESNKSKESRIVSMPKFLGSIFLFGIPIIGFISCLVMSIIPKNKSFKNFARAMLVKSIVSTCIIVTICVIVIGKLSSAFDTISDITNGVIDTYEDFEKRFGNLSEKDYAEYFELIEKYDRGEIDVDLNIRDKVKDKIKGDKTENTEQTENKPAPDNNVQAESENKAESEEITETEDNNVIENATESEALPEGYVSKDADASVEIGG